MDRTRGPRLARTLTIAAALLALGCGDDDGGTSEGTTTGLGESTTVDASASAGTGESAGDGSLAQLCVDTINMYRAGLGKPPYARWTAGEACADGQAESDAQSGQAHGAFGECGEWAQNECPGWDNADPEGSLTGCLAQMWAEGPGEDFNKHGHYINMSSDEYDKVACGFHVTADDRLWAIQNFQ